MTLFHRFKHILFTRGLGTVYSATMPSPVTKNAFISFVNVMQWMQCVFMRSVLDESVVVY